MILITDTFLEQILKQLLQNKLGFYLNNKQWREGKLLLFKQSGFFIELILQTTKKQEKFEIPIPYNCTISNDKTIIYFDYTLNTLVQNKPELLALIPKMKPITKNRFYDTVLEIHLEGKHEISKTI